MVLWSLLSFYSLRLSISHFLSLRLAFSSLPLIVQCTSPLFQSFRLTLSSIFFLFSWSFLLSGIHSYSNLDQMERSSSSSLLLEDENRRNRRGFFRRIISIFDEYVSIILFNQDKISETKMTNSMIFNLFHFYNWWEIFNCGIWMFPPFQFRFASKKETFIIIIASLFSFIAGFITPIHMFVVGRITTIYVEEKSVSDWRHS